MEWGSCKPRIHQKLGREGFHPKSQREHGPANALLWDFQHPELWENRFLSLWAPAVVFCCGSPGTYEGTGLEIKHIRGWISLFSLAISVVLDKMLYLSETIPSAITWGRIILPLRTVRRVLKIICVSPDAPNSELRGNYCGMLFDSILIGRSIWIFFQVSLLQL